MNLHNLYQFIGFQHVVVILCNFSIFVGYTAQYGFCNVVLASPAQFTDGSLYEGGWREDVPEGDGRVIYSNGEAVGQWQCFLSPGKKVTGRLGR